MDIEMSMSDEGKTKAGSEQANHKWDGHPRVTASSETEKKIEHEEYTEEKEERRRSRADKPFYPRTLYFNTEASRDGIRHFVEGIGDTNPLYRDKKYAEKTKYGHIIAPGTYLYTIMWGVPGRGATGIHGWYVGGDWEWYQPINIGDELKVVGVLRDLVRKTGKMGGGRTWIDYGDVVYINQKGEIVGKELSHGVYTERTRSGAAKKYRDIPKPTYTREEWISILDKYDKEEIRGSVPRYWEDVQIGDKLGPMIKGPLSVRDEIAWLMGAGSPYFRAHKMEYEYESRHPKLLEYVETEEADTPGDIPELVHILTPFARTIGVERPYDYGCQRMSWLCNLFTNWMGDDGFLWKMSGDERVFNQIGDITSFEGKVVKKYIDAGKCCVDIEAWAKNQRNEDSIPPHMSTVILPSRQYGPVVYPEPTPKLRDEVVRAKPLSEIIGGGEKVDED